MESNYITRLNLKYDKIKLREEFKRLDFKTFFTSPNIKDTWLRATLKDTTDYPIISSLHKLFEGSIIIGYKLQPNAYVHMHIDPTTLCAINIILSDDYAPAEFEGFGNVKYECALFNTSVNHAVPAYHEERLLLKFAYLNKSYDEIRSNLSSLSLTSS